MRVAPTVESLAVWKADWTAHSKVSMWAGLKALLMVDSSAVLKVTNSVDSMEPSTAHSTVEKTVRSMAEKMVDVTVLRRVGPRVAVTAESTVDSTASKMVDLMDHYWAHNSVEKLVAMMAEWMAGLKAQKWVDLKAVHLDPSWADQSVVLTGRSSAESLASEKVVGMADSWVCPSAVDWAELRAGVMDGCWVASLAVGKVG